MSTKLIQAKIGFSVLIALTLLLISTPKKVKANDNLIFSTQVNSVEEIPIINLKEEYTETSQESILTTKEFQDIQEQARIEQEGIRQAEKEKEEAEKRKLIESVPLYSIDTFEFSGIIYSHGYKWSYYSERVLPGGGLAIPGRHTANGFVRDGDGYIVLASNRAISKGTIINTPFGSKGKIYDICDGCTIDHLDVYTR